MAANKLHTADPTRVIKPLIDKTFSLPAGGPRYAANCLTPGAAPLEPSFSELEPRVLRFTLEPLGPAAGPVDRRDEATREMRRLVRNFFGRDALHWFDETSEEWRDSGSGSQLQYGAFFGSSYDEDGLATSKVFYEAGADKIAMLPLPLFRVVTLALRMMPNLVPLFTSITCRREHGSQRMTFLHRGVLRLADLGPLLDQLGLSNQLSGIMQTFGLALGGRFELPDKSVLLALEQGHHGPEFEIYVLLGMIPDLPRNFLDLLAMGLNERPRELDAMLRWLAAFTPESGDWPGNFSVLSVRTSASGTARVSLYLRPVEFEISRNAGFEMPAA
jgi:hypothetical protein